MAYAFVTASSPRYPARASRRPQAMLAAGNGCTRLMQGVLLANRRCGKTVCGRSVLQGASCSCPHFPSFPAARSVMGRGSEAMEGPSEPPPGAHNRMVDGDCGAVVRTAEVTCHPPASLSFIDFAEQGRRLRSTRRTQPFACSPRPAPCMIPTNPFQCALRAKLAWYPDRSKLCFVPSPRQFGRLQGLPCRVTSYQARPAPSLCQTGS